MKVTITPYNAEWPLRFREIQEQLLSTLQDVPIISTEHVGSTSIPSLAAKPVRDIDIIIEPSSLKAARNALTDANYTDCGEMNIPGRFAFQQPGYEKQDAAHGEGKDGEMRYNTYLLIEGCTALRNHLDVRRVLMENREPREEYMSVKRKLQAMEFDDILRTAGWSEEELEPVLAANR
ncbi:grpb/dephospho-CoA kinase [Aspergillus varians]